MAKIKLGSIVKLRPRPDGVEHRHGNQAQWEVVEEFIGMPGLVTLQLVGGTSADRLGAARERLILIRA